MDRDAAGRGVGASASLGLFHVSPGFQVLGREQPSLSPPSPEGVPRCEGVSGGGFWARVILRAPRERDPAGVEG